MGGAERLITSSLMSQYNLSSRKGILLIDGSSTDLKRELSSTFEGKIYEINLNRKNPLILYHLHKIIKEYDLVHVHLFPSNYWAVIYKLISFSNTPFIYTEHATFSRKWSNSALKLMDKFFYRQFDKLIAISAGVKNTLVNTLHIDPSKIELIYNGIDHSKFENIPSIDRKDFFSSPSFILIMIANFKIEKDHNTLIGSMKLLPPDVKLILVGNGALLMKNKLYVDRLGLSNRILFLGTRDDVPKLLKMSDVVIQSSNNEGFGLAAVEGMAAGKPVIATDIPGIREVVGTAGLLFEKHNQAHLAELVLKLKKEPDYYKMISEKCFNRSKKFALAAMLENLENLYLKVIQNKK